MRFVTDDSGKIQYSPRASNLAARRSATLFSQRVIEAVLEAYPRALDLAGAGEMTAASDQGAGIPFVMTKAMKAALRQRGYTDAASSR